MNEAERKALLELWREVPECRPTGIYPSATTDGFWDTISDRNISLHADGLARDAIVGWLMGHGVVKQSKTSQNEREVFRVVVSLGIVKGICNHGSGWQPTRLLALIAAARAVKGANRDQPST